MAQNIKTTWKELSEHFIEPKHLIPVEDLGRYGFTSEIINGMIRYDIFPRTFFVVGVVYVLRAEIFQVVETLLGNSLKLYESVEQTEAKAAEATKLIEEDPEILGKLRLDQNEIELVEHAILQM